MRPDKFKRRYRAGRVEDRQRRQIATEAARRLVQAVGVEAALREATEAEYYAAKRRAAAVLGHTVRPGDLPSDAELREQVLALGKAGAGSLERDDPEPGEGDHQHISEHLDRFTIYRMRLLPLERIKQDPQRHPEGDALYHSLQVFELAREVRPFDEEFLLAALLHDVGKAVEAPDHIAGALQALHGTISERTAWLIEHHHDLQPSPKRPIDARRRRAIEESEHYEDLVLLTEVDRAGRVPGMAVGTVEEALEYIRGLELEEYLEAEEEADG